MGSTYGPYIPTVRLKSILYDYMTRLGITKDELAWELATNTGKTYEAWVRRLYAIFSGEQDAVRFQTADEILTNLYLVDRWYTELDDLYQAAA